jgi:signal-transduction protein with cAMP-binding, CBS, and nucleotidyltransferase domain
MGLCSSTAAASHSPPLTIPKEHVEVIHTAPLFKHVTDEELHHLACYFTHRKYAPGELISEMGSISRVLSLIAGGTATVYVDHGGKETELASLGVSDYFGEISLVRDETVTSASIKAGPEGITLLLLTHDHWNDLQDQSWFRGCNQRLRLTANHRFAAKLKTIRFLTKVPDSSLDVLGGLFRLRTYKKGTVILAEGDPALGFFIMVDGTVRVSTSNNDGSIKKLHPIDPKSKSPYFGELSLLEKVQVTATITAEKDCLLLYLKPEPFLTFLGIVPNSVKKSLKDTIKKRARRALGSQVSDILDPEHVGLGIELVLDENENENK